MANDAEPTRVGGLQNEKEQTEVLDEAQLRTTGMSARVLEPNELSKGLSGKLTPPGEIYPTVFISTAVQGRHIGKFNSNLSFSSKRFKLFSSESNLGLIQIGLLNRKT